MSRVEVLAYVRFQDGGRERELMPGQTCDLPTVLADAFAAKGWVRLVAQPTKPGRAKA